MNNTECFLTEFDRYLFTEGTHYRSFEKLGAHLTELNGVPGTCFAVWAPNAKRVSVIGDFNGWDTEKNNLSPQAGTGIWSTFVPGASQGQTYKFFIESHFNDYKAEKSDPHAFLFEMRPKSASVIWDIKGYQWNDSDWMATRKERNGLDKPVSVYEVHLGSWRRGAAEDGCPWLTYRDMAEQLPRYVQELGYTHVELLPVNEHPLDASWGYQCIGYFAPTSRFGTPQEFMHLIDELHRCGIGVILDWVPSHFPKDGHALANFDGTHLYEHADPRQGEHRDWGTKIFNYSRREVSNFLISSALFWLEYYHIDGLRVDAVASMLYLDYSRQEGDWIPNMYGGRENLEAISFIKRMNEEVYSQHPDVMMIAEESTAWPMVSRPTYLGGLGFGFKWNMGWMNDVLEYAVKDPIHRAYHHNNLTFGMLYAYHENFILPFSHDEVVHGKRSMLDKMPGDSWQKFANLRALYGYMYAFPGKKLLFMGGEFGQWNEWYFDASLDWHLLQWPAHQGLQKWVSDLNHFYRNEPALYEVDYDWQGFRWVDCHDHAASIISFMRFAKEGRSFILAISNFTPIVRENYWVGVPYAGGWRVVLNSDAEIYGGGNKGNYGTFYSEPRPMHGQQQAVQLLLPPLATVYLKME
jgi:1,4-alpha-glucan branching enzyme